MSAQLRVVKEAPVWWRQHWFENCEQFGVERAGELVGFVEEVEWAEGGEPGSLVIEWRSREATHVRVAWADVVEVDPSRSLITLRPAALPEASEPDAGFAHAAVAPLENHWRAHCEGFEFHDSVGFLGWVEAVKFDPSSSRRWRAP